MSARSYSRRADQLPRRYKAFARGGRPPASVRLQAARPERCPPHALIRARSSRRQGLKKCWRIPVNRIDEEDGSELLTSPEYPELTTSGPDRVVALAHAWGHSRRRSRLALTLGWTFRHRRPPHGDCLYSQR